MKLSFRSAEMRSLMAEIKTAYEDELGGVSATIGYDERYRTSVRVHLIGDTARLTLYSQTAFMGSDGPGNAVPDPDKVIATVPANASAIVKAVKSAISGNDTLSRYAKPKDFEWNLGRDTKRTLGLNTENAQKALDWRSLPRDVWEAKWIKPPAAAPLKVFDGMKLDDLVVELRKHGVSLSDRPARWAGSSDRWFGYKLLDAKVTRMVNLLTASFPSSVKMQYGPAFYLDYQHARDGDGFSVAKSFQWDMAAKPRPVRMNIIVLAASPRH